MPEPAFHVQVLTEQGLQYESEAISVVAPGELGLLGILAHHAPLLTTLVPGRLVVRLPAPRHTSDEAARQAGTPDQTTARFTIGTGLLEVFKNAVTVITDRCARES